MILVDTQGPHGAYLLPPLLKAGLPAKEAFLEAGDLAFVSKDKLDIGIEVKRLDGKSTDLIQSLRTGRLSGEQLPKLIGPRGAYEYAWVLVEGPWTHNEAGVVSVFQGARRGYHPLPGQMSADELEKRMLTLEILGGLRVRYTHSRRDTLRFITALFRWWTDVGLDGHTSHLTLHRPLTFLPLSSFEQAATAWPGVGRRVAKAAAQYFGSVKRAVNGAPQVWAALLTEDTRGKTRKFGMKNAEKLIEFFRKGEP